MTRQFLLTIGVIMMMMVIDQSKADNFTDLRAVSTGVNEFSANLYKSIATNNDKNIITSPISAAIVLSMASFGAGGDTEKQMRSTLHLPGDQQISKNGYQSLITTLNSVKKVNLKLANKIYTTTGFDIEPEFIKTTSVNFKSEIESIDFKNADLASKKINEWCENNTEHRIKDIIQPDILGNAALVLINAVYFKGNWKKKFDSSETINKAFFTGDNSSIDVPMMYKSDNLNYGTLDEHDAQFVEIDYESDNENDGISMIIILPNTVDGLKKSGDKLNQINYQTVRDSGYRRPVELRLPKFKIESSIDLQSTLMKMGMSEMFTDNANFTGITKKVPLKISKVIQKGFIEVNEEGSEAAAATGIIMIKSYPAPPTPPIFFTIDKPFIFAILHGPTNTVLFQGQVDNPTC
ncbi:antitrypsin-like isoform X1 [Aphidius gifuensis]|uniref:antitrypsin-like isoform X1 n=1 Tax=Aphidius gifuensis TaxID=684658 RepID=UPI001CDC45F4|nr:antitrypsin-like isoform X1 [Aphidius gifuensis]